MAETEMRLIEVSEKELERLRVAACQLDVLCSLMEENTETGAEILLEPIKDELFELQLDFDRRFSKAEGGSDDQN